MSNKQASSKKPQVTAVFRESIDPYKKKLLALNPHLYNSLYNRASEIYALDEILIKLTTAAEEARHNRYSSLPPVLASLREALSGQPPLSWWKLFKTSLGRAFTGAGENKTNAEEKRYLSSISEKLTEIIRQYQSPKTKLLLEIRLTALEVDARLLELEKIPEGNENINQALDYLVSQFQLLIQELKKIASMPKEDWSSTSKTILEYTAKVNKLMSIVYNLQSNDPSTYAEFITKGYESQLKEGIKQLLSELSLQESIEETEKQGYEALTNFFQFFNYFPELLQILPPKELYNFLGPYEKLFIADPSLEKVRPPIFFSTMLKKYSLQYASECKARFAKLQTAIKEHRIDSAISGDPIVFYKNYFITENDLHHICSLIHSTKKDSLLVPCDPQLIQKEILNRLVLFASISQPKNLDAILKSFTEEEKESRYFLSQEIILEQFIRWRKQGIY